MLTPELETVCLLVRQAGAAVLQLYDRGVEVEYKDEARSDPVTSADKLANQMLVEGLRRAFPQDAILAEESAETADDVAARQKNPRLWCIDPIDGTREFIARSGHFMVMVGLARHNRARLGVLYQPTEQRLYWGTESEAWVEDPQGKRRLQVSSVNTPSQATLAKSRTHRSPTLERIAAELGVGRTLPTGSIGLKIAKICEQGADVYISTSDLTHEWDVCGPEAILRAAGGSLTDLLGRPLAYNGTDTHTRRGICASNGALHAASLAAIGAVLGDRVVDD
jgi:3'(2'), 5'-bisphosphate nucleotidase